MMMMTMIVSRSFALIAAGGDRGSARGSRGRCGANLLNKSDRRTGIAVFWSRKNTCIATASRSQSVHKAGATLVNMSVSIVLSKFVVRDLQILMTTLEVVLLSLPNQTQKCNGCMNRCNNCSSSQWPGNRHRQVWPSNALRFLLLGCLCGSTDIRLSEEDVRIFALTGRGKKGLYLRHRVWCYLLDARKTACTHVLRRLRPDEQQVCKIMHLKPLS